MKIIFLNLYSGKVERGAESFAHELAERFKKEHQVLFLKGNSDQVPTHQFSGNTFQKWFNLKRWFLDTASRHIFIFSVSQLLFIWRERPDWVIPMNGFWQVLLLKLLQPIRGYKILITGHSGPGWDERWNLYLHPNVFVATTQPALEWAKKTCSWTHVKLIPYGIDPGMFHPGIEPGNKLKLNFERPVFLCPSALVAYKRIDLSIKAVSELDKGSLIVLGKGPLKKKLKNFGKNLLGKRFVLDSVSYSQMPTMYSMADVVTLPSDPQENSPMVYVEALASGKPIVATDAPRVRWALEDSAIYVDPTDIKSYAQALEKALHIKVSPHKALEKFLWENVLIQYESILKS